MKRFFQQNAWGSKIVALGLVFFSLLVTVQVGLAAPRKGYEAQLQKLSTSLVLAPGETRTISVAFKNIAKETWGNAGDGYVSLYTFADKYRKSVFADASWIDATHPAILKESSLGKNKVGHFVLTLHAPEKTGVYNESFALVSEDTTWIPGGQVDFKITVKSAARKGFEAYQPQGPDALSIEPGKTQEVTLAFKNIGKTTWLNTGKNYVSLYTTDPKEHKSLFAGMEWMKNFQVTKIQEASVKPGETAHVTFVMHAPKKEGSYKETFALLSENVTWIPGASVSLPIRVEKNPLAASILLRSQKTVTAQGGEEIVYKVGIKNIGTASWVSREVRTGEYEIASTNAGQIKQLALNSTGTVEPGQIDFLSFTFNAPATKGQYTMKYQFAANGKVIPDAEIDIPVEVTEDAGDLLNSPLINNVETQNIIDEPIVRIGVLIVDDEVQNQVQVSCNEAWNLVDGNGSVLVQKGANEHVLAFYKNGVYQFDAGTGLQQAVSYLRFIPQDQNGICKIENFDKRATRNAAYAENTFRNILELRYNSTKNRTWMINELKMEDYLAGLGETSELSNYEFKKTLITIARTFALYQWERATKHASEYFHMNAYADDQVYRGYEYEVNNPSIRKAAEETRGITVNYAGATAITPYFSRSDGRTRDWHEVWGGTVAWAKSVPCPCDAANARKLWGHGVGLSASEALCMANNGQKWDEILHYFYQGIDLKKRWN